MMCDECGIRPASIHLTTISGGQTQEKNLCAACMSKLQKQMPNVDFSSLAGLLSGFFEATKANGGGEAQPQSDLVCSRCGQSYEEFRKTGLLGCANCYHEFHDELEVLLNRIHGNTQHAGRVPGGLSGNLSRQVQLDRLKQQLVKAIAEEEYESAASLRDQIRSLQHQLEEERLKKGGEAHE